jgi:hypothetical protein
MNMSKSNTALTWKIGRKEGSGMIGKAQKGTWKEGMKDGKEGRGWEGRMGRKEG